MTLATRKSSLPWPAAQAIDAPATYPFQDDLPGDIPASLVQQQLQEARNYWLATTRPDGRPHVAPIWADWVDNALYFQGAPNARWALNLRANPAAAVHLESGDDVVIVNGEVDHVLTDTALAAHLAVRWREKYGHMEPQADQDGVFRLVPRSIVAWGESLVDGARWLFPMP